MIGQSKIQNLKSKIATLVALLLALSAPLFAAAITAKGPVVHQAGLNGFTAVKTVTIDHTKVGSSTHTDFPLLFYGTYAYLKTTGNGGSVTSSSGYDIIFYPNADCSGTKLDHEIDYYSASTGDVSLWVRVGSLSHTTDTVIYLCYGKSSITTSQENKTGVWNSAYLAVYHWGDGTTLALSDSTSNAITLTNTATTAVSGKLRGGAAFNGTSAFVKNTSFSPPGSITIAFWQNVNASLPSFPYSVIIGNTWGGSPTFAPRILTHAPYSDSTLYWDFGDDSTGRVTTNYASYIGAWTHVVLTYNHSTGDHKIFLNGSQAATSTASKTNSGLGTGLYIGGCDNTIAACTGFTANSRMDLDEFQVSNTARSADWILAQYNNQNSPSTFYTITP